MQAWGLLELQAGNTWAALALLERSVRADPACSPVLRWRTVQVAPHYAPVLVSTSCPSRSTYAQQRQ